MSTLDYHDAHRPYVAAVVSALTTAGMAPTDWWADPNDPRDATIECGNTNGAAGVCLGWDEETGWYWGPADPAGGHLSFVHYMAEGVLPDAARVAAWFLGALNGTERAADWPPRYRDFGDDDEFETALRRAGGVQ